MPAKESYDEDFREIHEQIGELGISSRLADLASYDDRGGRKVIDHTAVNWHVQAVSLIELACREHGSDAFSSLEEAIACGRGMLGDQAI